VRTHIEPTEPGDLAARKSRSLILGLTLTAVAAFAYGGRPAWADDWDDCRRIVDVDHAISGCSFIITIGQESPDNLAVAYNNRAAAYGNKGDYDQEIVDENKAIELNPDFAEAYANRGATNESKGDHDRAIADETKAIELNPKLIDAYVNRGAAYAAIELNPTLAEAFNRAAGYTDKGGYDDAITDYDKAIELNAADGYAFYSRGNAYAAKGDPAR